VPGGDEDSWAIKLSSDWLQLLIKNKNCVFHSNDELGFYIFCRKGLLVVLVHLTDRILTDKNFDRQNFDRQYRDRQNFERQEISSTRILIDSDR
jgi:hypothetical protein